MNPSTVNPPAGFTVLLVDGDQTCLAIISDMLIRCGYKVWKAARASDALGIIKEEEDKLDLIIAQDQLPDMGRYQLLETVRDMSKLPVVLMSDNRDETAMMGGLFKGALQYLVKPVTTSDLRNLWQLAFVWKQTNGLVVRGFGPQEQQDTKRKQPQQIRKMHEDRDKRPKVSALEALDNDSQADVFGDLSLATGSLFSLSKNPFVSLNQGPLLPEPIFPLPNLPSSSLNFKQELGLFPTLGPETQGLLDDGIKQYMSIPCFGSSFFPGDDAMSAAIPEIEPFRYLGNPGNGDCINAEGNLDLSLGGFAASDGLNLTLRSGASGHGRVGTAVCGQKIASHL